MTVKEFYEHNFSMMTLEEAKRLKGKSIYWTFPAYSGNSEVIYEMIVGDIVDEISYYKNDMISETESRVDSWRKFMTKEELKRHENTLVLLNDKGEKMNIFCHTDECYFDELTFTCSDADRPVLFIEK